MPTKGRAKYLTRTNAILRRKIGFSLSGIEDACWLGLTNIGCTTGAILLVGLKLLLFVADKSVIIAHTDIFITQKSS